MPSVFSLKIVQCSYFPSLVFYSIFYSPYYIGAAYASEQVVNILRDLNRDNKNIFLCISVENKWLIFTWKNIYKAFCPLPIVSFFSAGCIDPSTKTNSSLFYCDSCHGSDIKAYYAPFQAQGLMVLSSLDAVYILDFSPCSWWNSSWPVDLSIWKNCSLAILAVCSNYCISTTSVFIYYVFNRYQRADVYKTWNSHWCLRMMVLGRSQWGVCISKMDPCTFFTTSRLGSLKLQIQYGYVVVAGKANVWMVVISRHPLHKIGNLPAGSFIISKMIDHS